MKHEELTTENRLAPLRRPLLDWFRSNARDLPWRRTRDPYRIWVSEIMLQQTRVAAVLGYYARFLEAFPTVEALAGAPEERLMKLWEGLGYYSRARNLQKAAAAVCEQYGGQFPADYDALLALPGIGEYTAGAIASAAFGLPAPAVDGNVLRVLARLHDDRSDIADPKTRQAARAAVASAMPESEADRRIFNQALMELGATVCVPNGPPRCEVCPAAELCLGRLRGTAEALPVKAPKKARQAEEMTVLVVLREGQAALRRRPGTGLLAGLWEFPNLPGTLTEQEAASALADRGLTVKAWKKKLTAKHIFTHREWHMTGYVAEVSGAGPEDWQWTGPREWADRAVPSAFARYSEAVWEEWGAAP
ncbi:A/G-specific adenine glycosylase [Dysosmobacter sp.]|uniref:A/G-specific adenine glycosylase n=1 Tax=Dysosmobacter sp. TaxID=2591382 RepID=UPI002A8CA50B|nr:A/G-specific adenine glycosylase [Dysosmobacter sp.]MDY3281818.1 A/G-specific adenine glycosylase [Dysosmobacter sp.]